MAEHTFASDLVQRVVAACTYAPIPLFAESFRVQNAMILAILSGHSITGCLTGCVKDLHKLWDLESFSLFGQFEGTQTAHVTGIRNGNTFQLANKALLDLCQITGRKDSTPTINFIGERETLLNICFIKPWPSKRRGNVRTAYWVAGFSLLTEVLMLGSITTLMVFNAMTTGIILMACVLITITMLSCLLYKLKLIFANANTSASDVQNTVEGGAALDVHVIATSWNSSRLDVVCGYESQLHALTNIPVRVTHPRSLALASRMLSVVLMAQAAALASLIGNRTIDMWSTSLWLFVYLLTTGSSSLFRSHFPEACFASLPGEVVRVPCLSFSRRRAALAFISRLPVTLRVPKWSWTDVFMPDNERRQKWQKTVDQLPAVTDDCVDESDLSAVEQCDCVVGYFAEVLAMERKPEFLHTLRDFEKSVMKKAVKTEEGA